jgi:hypothetical protein
MPLYDAARAAAVRNHHKGIFRTRDAGGRNDISTKPSFSVENSVSFCQNAATALVGAGLANPYLPKCTCRPALPFSESGKQDAESGNGNRLARRHKGTKAQRTTKMVNDVVGVRMARNEKTAGRRFRCVSFGNGTCDRDFTVIIPTMSSAKRRRHSWLPES